jgi:hypothetical protein
MTWHRTHTVLLVALVFGCTSPAPSRTDTPPTAPTIQMGDWTASNIHWTFSASVNPRGGPTDVDLEWGLGDAASASFDTIVRVDTGRLVAGVVKAELSLPPNAAFCVRFTARNDVGSTSTDPSCHGLQPSIVLPATLDSPGTSAVP